jgi:hypothetical protein
MSPDAISSAAGQRIARDSRTMWTHIEAEETMVMLASKPVPAPSRKDLARWRANLQDETDSAFLYDTLAKLQDDPSLADVYRRLAEVETKHAAFWRDRLRAANEDAGEPKPTRRARILAWAARRFGAQAILPSLVAQERTGAADYLAQAETAGTPMAADEHGHAKVLRVLAASRGGWRGGTARSAATRCAPRSSARTTASSPTSAW